MRLSNRFDNQFDNRLYRVNGALQTTITVSQPADTVSHGVKLTSKIVIGIRKRRTVNRRQQADPLVEITLKFCDED